MPTFKKKNIRLKEGIDNSIEVDVPVNGGSVQDAINTANQKDIVRNAASNGTNINYHLTSPNVSNPSPTATTFSSSVDDASRSISNGMNTVIPQANTMPECKTFSKKKIEEARLNNMRKKSATFTKKELNNLFKS